MFGSERLERAIGESQGCDALAIRERILGAVRDHVGGVPQGDDLTLAVVRAGSRPCG